VRRDLDRLQDILAACEAIERHAAGEEEFNANEMLQVWYLKHIEIIGEASARLSLGIRERYPEIPWREIGGMRNMLIHGYFDIDWQAVWLVGQRDLPRLRPQIRRIIEIEGQDENS